DRRRPLPAGAVVKRLRLRRRRSLPGGLRPDDVADLPDHGAPAGDPGAADGPRQRHGADGDLRRAAAGCPGGRRGGGPGRHADGAASNCSLVRALDPGDRALTVGPAARPAAAGRRLSPSCPLDPRPPPVDFTGGGPWMKKLLIAFALLSLAA